jgi:hypothetical protein
LRIVIETIPHASHRYPTVGDWQRDEHGVLQIRVSETADPRDALLVALHELIEAALCEQREISETEVTRFDTSHLDSDDQGDLPGAPYHEEHVFAECVERLFALELGRDWNEYDAALKALDARH